MEVTAHHLSHLKIILMVTLMGVIATTMVILVLLGLVVMAVIQTALDLNLRDQRHKVLDQEPKDQEAPVQLAPEKLEEAKDLVQPDQDPPQVMAQMEIAVVLARTGMGMEQAMAQAAKILKLKQKVAEKQTLSDQE